MTLLEEARYCAVHEGQCECCGAEFSILLGGACPACRERARVGAWCDDRVPTLGQLKFRHAYAAGLLYQRLLLS